MLAVKHLLSGTLQVIPSNTKYHPFFGAPKMNGSDRKSEDFCRKTSSYGESMDSDWWLRPTPSWKMMEWKSAGIMTFPIWWEIHKTDVPNHQPGIGLLGGEITEKTHISWEKSMVSGEDFPQQTNPWRVWGLCLHCWTIWKVEWHIAPTYTGNKVIHMEILDSSPTEIEWW